MLKPYEQKLQSIKDEIQKVGVDVVESLEICLWALENKKMEDLKNVDISEKKLLVKSNEIDNIIVTTLAAYFAFNGRIWIFCHYSETAMQI